jgi:hypothetical protein
MIASYLNTYTQTTQYGVYLATSCRSRQVTGGLQVSACCNISIVVVVTSMFIFSKSLHNIPTCIRTIDPTTCMADHSRSNHHKQWPSSSEQKRLGSRAHLLGRHTAFTNLMASISCKTIRARGLQCDPQALTVISGTSPITVHPACRSWSGIGLRHCSPIAQKTSRSSVRVRNRNSAIQAYSHFTST